MYIEDNPQALYPNHPTMTSNPNHYCYLKHILSTSFSFLLFISLLLLLPISPSYQQEEYTRPTPYDDGVDDLLNPRLQKAFIALQAWKHTMTCDPSNLTINWEGPHVCNYTGVFCAPAQDDPRTTTVAGIDLNHGQICGSLPDHLSLLSDLAVFHINSNNFCGSIPQTFKELELLYELDVSNNKLSGPFPSVVLCLPSLKFLDIRFNEFYGDVPKELYDRKLDAIFINNNNFAVTIPANIGNSPASVLVLANLKIRGCFPSSIANMADTLYELILLNNSLSSCLPEEIGQLKKLRVFDISFNDFVGPLPESMGGMKSLEQLNVAHNMLSGDIPESICELPRLKNFTYSDNYFCGEPEICLRRIKRIDDQRNCIPYRHRQRSEEECFGFLSNPVNCQSLLGGGCSLPPPPPPPPPSLPLPPMYH